MGDLKTTPIPGQAPNLAAPPTASPQSSDEFLPRFVPSYDLMISCGCVLLDLARGKIALLHDTETNTRQLPKGRKNMNEDILAAALRETFEETGIPCEALPLKVATRSTPTAAMLGPLYGSEIESVTRDTLNCEPSSLSIYRCQHTLALKLVFWFAARGDSTATPDDSLKEPWEQHLTLEWVDAQKASSYMSFEADASVINKVLLDVRASGYNI